MFTQWTVRSLADTLRLWMFASLIAGMALLIQLPPAVLAQSADDGFNPGANNLIHALAVQAPFTEFSGSPTSGVAPLSVQFTDESTGNPTGWAWYFGDEDFSEPWAQQTPSAGWSARSLHTSMALPDGSIVLMGGWAGGNRNDVWRSTDQGSTWVQMTANAGWSARNAHASVTLPDGSIVLMGGVDNTNSRNDVWRSADQGAIWVQMTASAGWSARYGHASVALPDGSILLMGGFGSGLENDVWRSADQGATWVQLTANAGWPARMEAASVVLPDGSIILMGGRDSLGTSRYNDVWRSTDQGATWEQMTASAEWSTRNGHTSVVLPDGSIVLMGGYAGSRRNDVWRSTDQGATWEQITDSTEWSARYRHTSVALPDGSIVLMGGMDSNARNDVWRWETAGSYEQNPSHTYTAPGTYTVTLQAYNASGYESTTKLDYIEVLAPPPDAEFSGDPTIGTAPLDVQFTDESTGNPTGWAWYFGDEEFSEPWVQQTASAGWTARRNHASVVLPDGSIVLMGGYDSSPRNDVWRSTDRGATWTQMTAGAAWSARNSHASVVLPDGSIVLMGGYDGSGRRNDVWRSTDNGVTWAQVTASAGWSARYGMLSVLLHDGSLLLIGGNDGISQNDVWRSTDQGATWAQINANAEWPGRDYFAVVVLADNSIVLMGGESAVKHNDVWRSTDQGASWTQLAAAAEWAGRYGLATVVVPDGSIVLMGGAGYDNYRWKDVWRSTDQGATWTLLTDSAGWAIRNVHTSVALPDGSIVLMGGYNTLVGNLRDVWRWETAASYEQHPSHTYAEPGIYPVALQAYHSDGYGSTRKAAYITVNAPPAPAAPNVTIALDDDDVVLSWLPVTQDVNGNLIAVSHYEVWRSLSPYCIPGETGCPEPLPDNEPADTLFVDVDAALTATPYFYQVRAVSAAGVASASSDEAGKFGFTLAPGESFLR